MLYCSSPRLGTLESVCLSLPLSKKCEWIWDPCTSKQSLTISCLVASVDTANAPTLTEVPVSSLEQPSDSISCSCFLRLFGCLLVLRHFLWCPQTTMDSNFPPHRAYVLLTLFTSAIICVHTYIHSYHTYRSRFPPSDILLSCSLLCLWPSLSLPPRPGC